jgi:flagellar protein FlbD
MIELTRLNGNKIAVNCDLIRYIEASPDTVLTLVTGEKLIVLESYSAVSALAFQYRVALLRSTWPDASSALAAHASFEVTRDDRQTFSDRD